jgi:hypothetical protein
MFFTLHLNHMEAKITTICINRHNIAKQKKGGCNGYGYGLIMVFIATFNSIFVASCRSVLLVEGIGGHTEN